ncbi:hypothetical protein A3A38_04740 [Candidatus Kaiserbacteria bacterium RIFCSPLOWO2_01_FULL_53_17]|uniref:Transposase n=1 Tax=Candidatus Kaiserbacteria bacterium RIFCSPLOWO2_01_FULL_53_17 TaxID=1798511 RepID=A0A1F6EHS6_9BACT|nr:MAG: hypothetical protein A3A38_04740 [Candidatus Kaiserbacteria bacterium RIFCSPLOWO2_01_FULL_53_17]
MVRLWYMKPYKRTIRLSEAQITKLQNITTKGRHKTHVVVRARVLLLSQRAVSKNEIAHRLDIDRSTVQAVRKRFHEGGLDRALHDAPRSGQPPKITEKVEAHLVAIACSSPPTGYDSWTLEMLQKKLIDDKKLMSISTVAIWQHLHNRGIKPWRGKNVVRAEVR